MTVYNLGSINIDRVYRVPHLPRPGETLAATAHFVGLGGKGANQSAAAARAGAHVVHIGAVGADGGWAVDRLRGFGVETSHVREDSAPTGHAVICIDGAGENLIVIEPGANARIEVDDILRALGGAAPGSRLILQNETSCQAEAARIAQRLGLEVLYSAAPYDTAAVQAVLPYVGVLLLNAVEAEQLAAALGAGLAELPVPAVLVTRGAGGVDWLSGGEVLHLPAFRVEPVDTTGAGDTFAGWFVAGRDAGLPVEAALREAAAAAALKVMREGAAEAIPERAEVEAFLRERL